MKKLEDVLYNIKGLDVNDFMQSIYEEPEFQRLVGFLNTEQQLYLGIDSKGESLGEYSDSTIAYKKRKNQVVDRVTLKDTGDFYSDFDIIPQEDGFLITNVNEKALILIDKYGNNIFGLVDENLQKVINYIKVRLKIYFLQTIIKNI